VSNAALPASGTLDSFSVEHMRERGAGHVVLVSSLSGKISSGYASVYNATKFGLRGFGLAVNDELHGTGVGVTVLSPGFIRDAGMFADSGAKLRPGIGTKTPDEVAAGAVTAIEKGPAELDVAPLSLKLTGRLYGLAPSLFGSAQRALGGHKIGEAMAKGQADKR
jgi:short-subunit dehydrogenase